MILPLCAVAIDMLVFLSPATTFGYLTTIITIGRKKTVDQLEDKAELLRAESDYLEDEIEYLLGYMSR